MTFIRQKVLLIFVFLLVGGLVLSFMSRSQAAKVFRIMNWESDAEMVKWQKCINDFFAKYYPDVKVEINNGVDYDEYPIKLRILIAAGNPPDLAWFNTYIREFGAQGMLVDLNPFIEKNPPPDWPDGYAGEKYFNYKGHQLGLAYDNPTHILYYNKTLFDEAGLDYPDENWRWDEQVLDAAKRLTKDTNGDGKIDQYGIVSPITQWDGIFWYSGCKSFGGDFWNKEMTESLYNLPGTVKAFKFFTDLVTKYKVSPPPEVKKSLGGERAMFIGGKVAAFITLQDEAIYLDHVINGAFKYGVAPEPYGPSGRFARSGNGSGFVIPMGSKNPQIAYELAKYLVSNPVALIIQAIEGSIFVSRKEFMKYATCKYQPFIQDLPNFYYAAITYPEKYGIAMEFPRGFEEIMKLTTKEKDLVLLGKKSAEEACRTIKEEMDTILKRFEG